MDVTIFRPKIDKILLSADLETVSAKKVRKQLQADLGLDLTAHKKEVDELIRKCFNAATGAEEVEVKPKIEHLDAVVSKTPTSPKRQKVKHEVKEDVISKEDQDELDARYARELQASYNSPRASRSAGVKAPPKKKRKVAKKRKTEMIVNSDGETVEVEVKRKVASNGFNKLLTLSPELEELLGVKYLSRPQVSKQIWAYIKKPENSLQDMSDKRYINCDEKLEGLLGTKRVHMFTMTKLLQKHMKDDGTAPIGYGDGADLKPELDSDEDGDEIKPKVEEIKRELTSSSEDED